MGMLETECFLKLIVISCVEINYLIFSGQIADTMDRPYLVSFNHPLKVW